MPLEGSIVLVTDRIARTDLERLVGNPFQDMVKFVVDIDRDIAAVGGELHADTVEFLLQHGSRSSSLWGGNYFPGRGEQDCIVFASMINVRPSAGNRSLAIQDPALRQRVRDIVFARIGRGEPLS